MKVIPVAIAVVDGGIGINWHAFDGLPEQGFKDLLREIKLVAGFPHPDTVRFRRNKDDGSGVDWYRLRIASDDCQVNGVSSYEAVLNLRRFFAGPEITERWGLKCEVVGVSVSDRTSARAAKTRSPA